MNNKKYVLIFLLFSFIQLLYSQEAGKEDKSANNPSSVEKSEGLIIEPDINYWGMNADVSIFGFELFNDLSSRILISGGAGIRSLGYYRDENDEFIEKDDGTYDVYGDFKQLRIHTNWGAGLTQGIIDNSSSRNDLLYAVLKYRGVREWNIQDDSRDQIIFNSVRDDKDGILLNSFIAALVFDSTSKNRKSGNIKGFYSEVSVERAPEWFFNDIEGKSDFIKYYGSFSFFIPFKEFLNNKAEPVSGLYLAECFSADLIGGEDIPLLARQTMGSLSPKNGLGGAVRGFESRRFDGEFTMSNNIELRMNLPVIKPHFMPGSTYLRPGAFVFFDAGYYDLLAGAEPGTIVSCGGGVSGDISGIIQGLAFLSFPLKGERLDEKTMDFSLSLNFHF